jgi:type II secretory pathway pseudopilin PulG
MDNNVEIKSYLFKEQTRMENDTHLRRRRRAFTMTEMIITVFLIALVFISTMTLFERATLAIARARAGTNASVSASVAYARVNGLLSEAAAVVLPGDPYWDATKLGPAANYINIKDGQSVYTGILIQLPKSSGDEKVIGNTVADEHNLTGDQALVNRAEIDPNNYILLYRGDAKAPYGSNVLGKALLMKRSTDPPNSNPTVIISNVSENWEAVVFGKPGSIKNNVSVRIVTGEASRMIGEQTNERSDGEQIATGLQGSSVLMRNTSKNPLPRPSLGAPSDPAFAPEKSTEPTPTPVPTPTPTPTPVPTPTPKPTPTPTPKPSPTPTPVPTPKPSPTPTPVPTPTPKPTPTPTPKPSPTPTPKPTPTPVPTPTPKPIVFG